MKTDLKTEGRKAATRFPGKWREICEAKKDRRHLELKPLIQKEILIGNKCRVQETQILERQNRNGCTNDPSVVNAIIKDGWNYLFWAIVSFIASISSLYYVFAPFQLGSITIFMVTGFSAAVIAGIHIALKSYFEEKWLLLGFSALGALMALFGHIYLAAIRGKILEKILAGSDSFYENATKLLGVALPFISISVEILAGILIFRALENLWAMEVQDYRILKKVRKRMVKAAIKIEYLKNLPEKEAHEFYEGALEGESELKSNEMKQGKESPKALLVSFFILIFIILTMFSVTAFAETPNITVVALDLSQSSTGKDNNGDSEFHKNLKAVEDTIMQIEPDSRLIVFGITDDSFSNPMIFLDSVVAREPGFFKEKIKAAREKLLKKWRGKSKSVSPKYKKTNIFGAIYLAAHLVEGASGTLIILSDLRHYSDGFDLESPTKIDVHLIIQKVEQEGLIPLLSGVDVYCLGVHSRGKSPAYWFSLKKFWETYISKAKGNLKKYSIIRGF